ncbi:MAG: hypothetical protein JW703_03275 [Candidatus Diapherotrites archaeon]|nr:hypothetical protein [Candidatus Diapherotrites archaeon]
MERRYLIFLIVLFLGVILSSGCTQQSQEQKTCSQLSGYDCKENESCFGKLLNASDSENCCAVTCTEKTQSIQSNEEPKVKTCSEQNGFNCKTGEKCEGTTIEASGTATCCSVNCTSIQTETKEKALEEMNLKKEDFSEGFVLNDVFSGYQKNALEYKDGNQDAANDLLAAGWQENYAVEYIKRSETQEIMGTKIILEDYFASLSRYDVAKDYVNRFKKSIEENKKDLENNGNTMLSQKFGDNSTFAKYTETNQYTGLTTVSYTLYFTKNNIYVNFYANGQSRQITDEKVIELARKIESRIGS